MDRHRFPREINLPSISFRWSFGGNRVQIKAEDKILGDVASALRSVAAIAANSHGPYKSLQQKQELTQILIDNERSRLRVWLYPLELEKKHHMPSIGSKTSTDVRPNPRTFFTP